ncbi:hypothetical protein A8924_2372 [Saccharopolyspora erythraea NRRL 2338]|nr:hypothetical protein A8924_2372 [Saccharopolyspora erythraea NRRL 2338]
MNDHRHVAAAHREPHVVDQSGRCPGHQVRREEEHAVGAARLGQCHPCHGVLRATARAHPHRNPPVGDLAGAAQHRSHLLRRESAELAGAARHEQRTGTGGQMALDVLGERVEVHLSQVVGERGQRDGEQAVQRHRAIPGRGRPGHAVTARSGCVAAVVPYRIPATDAMSCSMPAADVTDDDAYRAGELLAGTTAELGRRLRRAGIR